MDEIRRHAMYADLQKSFPGLFANPPGARIEVVTDPAEVAEAEAYLPPDVRETGVLYADPYVLVVRDAVRTPSGEYGSYVRMVPPGNAPGVVVLPLYRGEVVLVRHFRHSTRDWHWELPRGFGSPDADPSGDVRRELREEIGAGAGELHDLGLLHPDTGLSGTPVRLYLAVVTGTPVPAGADEGIDAVRLVPPAELARMIADERVTDGFTIAAYTRARLRGLLTD